MYIPPDEEKDSKYQGDVSDRVLLDCNEWYQSVTLSPAVISILFCHPNLRSELYSRVMNSQKHPDPQYPGYSEHWTKQQNSLIAANILCSRYKLFLSNSPPTDLTGYTCGQQTSTPLKAQKVLLGDISIILYDWNCTDWNL